MTEKLDAFDKARLKGDSFDRAKAAAQTGDAQPVPQPAPETQPEPEPQPETQPEPEPQPELQPEPQPELQPAPQQQEEVQPQEESGEEPSTGFFGLGAKIDTGNEGFDKTATAVRDLGLMPLRGAEAAIEGVYGFLDFVSGDRLWDWDRTKNSAFGKSSTTVGKIGVSLVQFGVGFVPGLNVATWLGKASKLKGMASALSKSKGALKSFSKNQLSLSPATMKNLSKLKSTTKTNVRIATASALSEFFVFKGQEERLSNMLASHDGEEGGAVQDFINWLAYDPDDENSNELVERGKLALEGLIVGEALGLAFLGVGKGFRKIKPKREAGEVTSESVMDPPETGEAVSGIKKLFSVFASKNKNVKKQQAAGEEVDELKAVEDAINDPENVVTPNERNAMNEMNHRVNDQNNAKDWEAQTGESLSDGPRAPGVEDAEEAIPNTPSPTIKSIDPDKATEKELDDWFRERGMTGVKSSLETKRAHAKDMLKESKAGGKEHLLDSVEQHTVNVVKKAGLYDETNPQAMLSGLRVLNSVTEMRAFLGHISRAALKASNKGGATAKEAAEFYEQTSKILNMGVEGAGGKRGDIDLEPFRARVEDLAMVRAEADVLYDGMNNVARDLQEKVANARTAIHQDYATVKVNGKDRVLNQDEAMTEVYSAMDRFTALQEIWADFGTQLSLGLRQRQDLYRTGQSALGRDIAGQHRTLGVAVDDALKTQGKLFRRQNNQGLSDKRIIKDLEKLFKKSGPETPLKMGQLTKDFNQVGVSNALSRFTLGGRKGLAISQEWYYNAILGAPTSWVVNFLGGALVLPLRHIESIAGGVATGNMNLVKANFRVMFDLQSFSDAARYAWKSGIDDEARSVTGYTAYRDDRLYTPKGEIRVENPDGTAIRSAINFMGHVIRHPSRVMMAGDEFFKQMSYRARIKTSLAVDGYKKGLHRNPGKLAQHIDEGFNATITKDGRFRNEENVRREAIDALVKARKSGADVPNEREFIKDYMADHFSNQKLKRVDGVVYKEDMGFEQRNALVESGKDWALVNTFTNEVTNKFFKKTGEIASMSPWLGFVIPFIRTPSNILMFALRRTLPTGAPREIIGSLKDAKAVKALGIDDIKNFDELPESRKMAQNLLDQIQNESSIKAAEAIGRLSTGLMTMGTLFMNIETLKGRITGSPPQDPGKREAWAATGKMAFSIKFGDKWHSYQRLDPFATTLGIMADIAQGFDDIRDTGVSEFGDEEEFEEQQEKFLQVAGILTTAFANNTMKKSYIENLGELLDVFSKPAESFSTVGSNILGGFVPNGLNWSQNVFQEEPAILEARGFLDKMRKRLPESMRPGRKIMPRRNAFGEIIRKSKNTTGDLRKEPSALLKGMWPIFSSDVSNDMVDMEIEHQAVGRQPMGHGRNIGVNRVNYKSYRNDKDQTAFDRMQELSGTMKLGPSQRTLRQALRKTIESNAYQNLPPVTESNRHKDHPRSKALTKVINAYRAEARRQTTGEFKQLKADLAQLLR